MNNYDQYVPNVEISHLHTPAGAGAPYQLIVETSDARIFQSYRSTIAIIVKRPQEGEHRVVIGRHWDHSNTTLKYLKQFLGHSAAETRHRIDTGEYHYEWDMT